MKTAIILAAGEGSKIWPYGVTKNKSVIPIANRPIISWTIDSLRAVGIKEIVVVTGYRHEQIAHVLRGEGDVILVDQKGAKGTVPALLRGWEATDAKDVVVIYGDVIFAAEDLERVIQDHKSTGAKMAALVAKLEQDRPNDWLCAQVSGETIEYVLGHPRDDVTHRFGGVFAFDRSMIPFLKQNPGIMHSTQVGMMTPTEAHIEESLQLAIDAGIDVLAVEAEHKCVDVDKPWHILGANEAMLRYQSSKLTKNVIAKSAKISDGATIDGRVVMGTNSEIGAGVIVEGDLWVGDNTKIIQGAVLEPLVSVGNNCTVRRYCQVEAGSSIGDRCFIGHAAEVAGVMMPNSYSYHYGEYWGVIGTNSDLGAATVCGNLRFDDAETEHRIKGRREVPTHGANAAYLGDFCRTGVNTIIMPGVKVGPYSVLGAGAIIENDVPDRTIVFVKQEQVRKAWGPERYGW